MTTSNYSLQEVGRQFQNYIQQQGTFETTLMQDMSAILSRISELESQFASPSYIQVHTAITQQQQQISDLYTTIANQQHEIDQLANTIQTLTTSVCTLEDQLQQSEPLGDLE